jgi:imidazolonepropionase-like amidohydrolase
MIKIYINIRKIGFLICLSIHQIVAQNPLPGVTQPQPIVLSNGTIHTGTGQVIIAGSLLFEKGIIKEIGTKIPIPKDAQIIDLGGQHVYPGLIAMGSQIGLSDVASIPATNDFAEMGSLNPNVRALVAYNTDSDVIPTVRSNGVLLAQATPTGGFLSGQSAIMQLDGWNWQDAVLKPDDGIWITWPAQTTRQFSLETMSIQATKNEKRKEAIEALTSLFSDAKTHNSSAVKNLKLEAVQGLFTGQKVLYIIANEPKEIIEAVQLAQAQGIQKTAIVGGSHALECIDFLKENNITVVLNNTHEVPSRADDPVYSHYNLATKLQNAGINTIISYQGMGWRYRNLAYLAGTAAGHGLNKETALQMISLAPAKLMGIDQLVGSLEVGKHATLVVSKGDLLDMRSSEVTLAYIQGRAVDLNNKHKQLYQKFLKNIKAK